MMCVFTVDLISNSIKTHLGNYDTITTRNDVELCDVKRMNNEV